MTVIEIDFNGVKETYPCVLKQANEIDECEEGKIVVLCLKNGEVYTGVFKGIDDDDEDVMLESLNKKHTIGLKTYWIKEFYEVEKN